MTDHDGNPRPWLTAEEIGYCTFCEGLTLRQIVSALTWFSQRGLVKHDGIEWKLTGRGLEQTRIGLPS